LKLLEITILLLTFATLASALTKRTKLPAEIVWVLGSLLIGFIPSLPRVAISHEVIFFVFLPPVLFAAAYFTSWRDFQRYLRPILLLSVGLVVITAAAVACIAHYLIPDCSWPLAFVLGAVVSPPDASAATAIIKQLKIPRRIVTIIEGESLVNDATALVILEFALAAMVHGEFSLSHALGQFVFVFFGSLIVGYVLGWISIRLLKIIPQITADTVWSLIVAFAAYIIGERLDLSGVITTVAAGLYFGRKFPEVVTAQANIEAEATWQSVLFIMNGLVFSIMGLQFPVVLEGLHSYPKPWLAEIAFLTAGVVILVRFLWVFPASYLPRLFPYVRRTEPKPTVAKVATIGWIGMRGIVSLAAALSLPMVLETGEEFPHRNLFLFITYIVVLTTLLLPSLTMSLWVKAWKMKGDGETEQDRTLAHLELLEESLATLEKLKQENKFPAEQLNSHLAKYNRKRDILKSNLAPGGFSPLLELEQAHRQIQRKVLGAFRRKLSSLRQRGEIHDEIFHEIRRELDNEELRMKGTLL
jgi:monovalent cation/hydrogen antiporter